MLERSGSHGQFDTIVMGPHGNNALRRMSAPVHFPRTTQNSTSDLLPYEDFEKPAKLSAGQAGGFLHQNLQRIQKRHLLIFLGFIGVFNNYTMIINLSVAIVAMINFKPPVNVNASLSACRAPWKSLVNQTFIQSPQFNWNTKMQGNILAAYFYGYLAMQVPSAWLSRRFGGKHIFGFGILSAGIITLIMPAATSAGGERVAIGLRVLEGLSTGCAYPAMHQLLTKWCPSRERTKLCVIVFMGAPIGSVVAMALSGYVGALYGWQWIFYVFGVISCVWFVFWTYFVTETPNDHSTITQSERDLIAGKEPCIDVKIQPVDTDNLPVMGQLKSKDAAIPWGPIFRTPAVWAIIFGQFGHNWGNFTLLTNLPTYMKNIQQISLSSNGFLSALPYLLLSVVDIIGAYASDYVRHRNILSTTNVRKVNQTIGNIVPAICIIAVGYIGCDWRTAVALFTIGTGVSGLTSCGFQVNFQDIAPVFAPLIFGISTTFTAAFAIILPPHVVGIITATRQTEYNWRIIFYISGAIRVATVIFYDIFASGEPAAWNYVGDVLPNVKQVKKK